MIFARIINAKVALQLRLRGFEASHFSHLLRQLPAELGNCLVALNGLEAREFALMPSIAQLLFERGFGFLRRSRHSRGKLRASMHSNLVDTKSKADGQQDSSGILKPNMPPDCFSRIGVRCAKRNRAVGCQYVAVINTRRLSFLLLQSCEESCLGLFFGPVGIGLGMASRQEAQLIKCFSSRVLSLSLNVPEVATAQSSRNSSWDSLCDNAPAPRLELRFTILLNPPAISLKAFASAPFRDPGNSGF